MPTARDLWHRYRTHLCAHDGLGLRIDPSRMGFPDDLFDSLAPAVDRAFDDMAALERGAIANPDENRRVGHYWLRAPWLAPTADITRAIEEATVDVKSFAARVLDGDLRASAGRFTDLLVIGIGGSALGTQLVVDALGGRDAAALRLHVLDNTDPDGMARVLDGLASRLETTLVVVISKSGGTPETRNGMLVARAAFASRDLPWARQAVAVTGVRSELDRRAKEEDWLARFPMWDWVGGRTSVTSAVGLLPAALSGIDIDGFLAGAAACDEVTREREARSNPAMLLALMWHWATGGVGARDMVVLPYKDRLLLLSRYLQQLVMESLGKGRDREGRSVAQGLTVYGNKGSTDQHAYVQQLRDGVANFFVTFVAVSEDGGHGTASEPGAVEVEPGVTSGDYLRGFWLGTRAALAEQDRDSMTITIPRVDPWGLGVLIALFERAVGFYASLVGINAYHQPGVEAGKKAASAVLELQHRVLAAVNAAVEPRTADQLAVGLGEADAAEDVFHLLEGLSANGRVMRQPGSTATAARYAPATLRNPNS